LSASTSWPEITASGSFADMSLGSPISKVAPYSYDSPSPMLRCATLFGEQVFIETRGATLFVCHKGRFRDESRKQRVSASSVPKVCPIRSAQLREARPSHCGSRTRQSLRVSAHPPGPARVKYQILHQTSHGSAHLSRWLRWRRRGAIV
jgi:hypothetical protein